MKAPPDQLPQIGWRPYLAIPDLDIRVIRTKVDTGARTSALDSSEVEVYESEEGIKQSEEGIKRVRFQAHPCISTTPLVPERDLSAPQPRDCLTCSVPLK